MAKKAVKKKVKRAAPVEDEAADQAELVLDGDATPEKKAASKPEKRKETKGHPHTSGPLGRMMDDNFLQYASYVICERAIPALADGLKPVQRRIMHALHDKDDGRFIKVANVVGHTMQYHPHGDASIGDALVTLVNKGGYLIEGQGNFGNLFTGNDAAAPRYIECRLTDLARKEVFHKALTEYVPSYDGRNKEPVLFPCKLPLLLMLGADGIAVGLATRILPHNFPELLEAEIHALRREKFELYPDFLQGGLMDASAMKDGIGTARVRARIKTTKNGRLVITELPALTNTESLIASIEDAIRKKNIPIRSISDFTAEKVEIEMKLSPGADPDAVIKALYAYTGCETTVSSSIVVIHEGRPVEMTVPQIVKENARLLEATLKAELEHRRDELGEEINGKTLVEIFVEKRIYKDIEECKTADAVRKAVVDGFKPYRKRLRRALTDQDVEMLLGIRIRRISRFDLERNRKEIEKLVDELAAVEKDLKQLRRYTIRYLKNLIKTYGDQYPRKTELTSFKQVEVKELAAEEFSICYNKETGYLGHSSTGDELLKCSRFDKLILVWSDGRYRVVKPPEKMFVDKTLLYCATFDRDKEFTAVYHHDLFVFLKRFTFGGAILEREYRYAADPATVHLFQEGTPKQIFVKYKPAKRQRVHQQCFEPKDVAIKGVKAMGNHMTGKPIVRIATEEPRWWKKDDESPRGRFS
ncbi:MAG: DNA topoisomerase IV subunit A [Kiritimatiellia bacterium]|jgi:topoisomerase-4 subunit A|nr:DNA topoisomerase IV subunit A [Kiritimatiellia bacterium]MDP6630446.1 DNA topoisomerase IV subunit A [Kiritimatiellia bacterium]MDP6809903.1 DNA topoisomerase IV subunit A [Kiritimatiellia bacterium]MDP7024295.1 DNA topoisomerase IV subunit A [Kiritimatiellia bacterium]